MKFWFVSVAANYLS